MRTRIPRSYIKVVVQFSLACSVLRVQYSSINIVAFSCEKSKHTHTPSTFPVESALQTRVSCVPTGSLLVQTQYHTGSILTTVYILHVCICMYVPFFF